MQCGYHTFWPNNKEDRHTVYTGSYCIKTQDGVKEAGTTQIHLAVLKLAHASVFSMVRPHYLMVFLTARFHAVVITTF